ncbi:hypothetical protein LCGC14_1454600 [marine sediment metagenome]|uniref:Uncharacterized protein n=1 Tax=marine sediment metagenome TaxID=412755 RepID=A0A0F9K332_9ZZZZ
MVRVNLSGLHEQVHKMKYFHNSMGWYDESGDIGWSENDKDREGCWGKMFNTLEDAEILIAGAKFFRNFMCQGFFTERNYDE